MFVNFSINDFLSVFQYVLATDCFHLCYSEEGHCKGDANRGLPFPTRLQWQISKEVTARFPTTSVLLDLRDLP